MHSSCFSVGSRCYFVVHAKSKVSRNVRSIELTLKIFLLPREAEFLALVKCEKLIELLLFSDWHRPRTSILSSIIQHNCMLEFSLNFHSVCDECNTMRVIEKKSIKTFQWLTRKQSFCWHTLCCFLYAYLHKSWYENAINRLLTAAAWENAEATVAWSPCRCLRYVAHHIFHLIFFMKVFIIERLTKFNFYFLGNCRSWIEKSLRKLHR